MAVDYLRDSVLMGNPTACTPVSCLAAKEVEELKSQLISLQMKLEAYERHAPESERYVEPERTTEDTISLPLQSRLFRAALQLDTRDGQGIIDSEASSPDGGSSTCGSETFQPEVTEDWNAKDSSDAYLHPGDPDVRFLPESLNRRLPRLSTSDTPANWSTNFLPHAPPGSSNQTSVEVIPPHIRDSCLTLPTLHHRNRLVFCSDSQRHAFILCPSSRYNPQHLTPTTKAEHRELVGKTYEVFHSSNAHHGCAAYAGTYRALEVVELSKAETKKINKSVMKTLREEIMADIPVSDRTADVCGKVGQALAMGFITIDCLSLRYVGFNHKFYAALLDWKQSEKKGKAKRAFGEVEEGDERQPRKQARLDRSPGDGSLEI